MLLGGISCRRKAHRLADERVIERELSRADSLYTFGKDTVGTLESIRAKLEPNSMLLCSYYLIRASQNSQRPEIMERFADSALSFFSNAQNIKQHGSEFVQALLHKGDACLKTRRYNDALIYYFKGKTVLEQSGNTCLIHEFASRMATLYFEQKKYLQAARYWEEVMRRMEHCRENMTPAKLFYSLQGSLNNAGYSYERANMIDSALLYYLRDLALIDREARNPVIDQRSVHAARLVVTDNLGGIYLKKGDLPRAKKYLLESISLDSTHHDESTIPPLIKLADLYVRSGDLAAADRAFRKSEQLLHSYYASNIGSAIRWYQLRSAYFFKRREPVKAYQLLQRYIVLRDSVENNALSLYNVDIQTEFKAFQQADQLAALEKSDQMKKYYLVIAVLFLVMLLVIVVLVSKNLKNLRRSSEATTAFNAELQQTLGELEEANRKYLRILQVMAHDLKSPLSGITGLVAVLLDDHVFTEEQTYMLKLIESTGTHSIEMINGLLKSGLTDDQEKLSTEPVDLRALIAESVELLQFRADEKHQVISFECPEQVTINVNKEKIWRVLNNLIVNAIKFSPDGSVIQVALKLGPSSVLLSVADRGIGIPSGHRELIFEMFSPAKRQGTKGEQPFGLGLSISRRIVEKHGGQIWFEDRPGGGSIFFVKLPGNL